MVINNKKIVIYFVCFIFLISSVYSYNVYIGGDGSKINVYDKNLNYLNQTSSGGIRALCIDDKYIYSGGSNVILYKFDRKTLNLTDSIYIGGDFGQRLDTISCGYDKIYTKNSNRLIILDKKIFNITKEIQFDISGQIGSIIENENYIFVALSSRIYKISKLNYEIVDYVIVGGGVTQLRINDDFLFALNTLRTFTKHNINNLTNINASRMFSLDIASIQDFDIDETHLYWTSFQTERICRMTKSNFGSYNCGNFLVGYFRKILVAYDYLYVTGTQNHIYKLNRTTLNIVNNTIVSYGANIWSLVIEQVNIPKINTLEIINDFNVSGLDAKVWGNLESLGDYSKVNVYFQYKEKNTTSWFSTYPKLEVTQNNTNFWVMLEGLNPNVDWEYRAVVEYNESDYIGTNNPESGINIKNAIIRNLYKVIDDKISYIAVGFRNNNYCFKTSNDGFNWTSRTLVWDRLIYGIDYDENSGMWAIVGENGRISTSYDGINWVSRNSTTTRNLISVKYSKTQNRWVAVGEWRTLVTSVDGINWQSIDISDKCSSSTFLRTIKFSEELDLWITAGSISCLLTSNDGFNWTVRSSGSITTVHDLAYSIEQEKWRVVGWNGDSSTIGKLAGSDDGLGFTWINANGWTLNTGIQSIIYVPFYEYWFASGMNGHLRKSVTANYNTWGTLTLSTNVINRFDYNERDNLLVGVGQGGRVVNTNDGVNWHTQVIHDDPYCNYYDIRSINEHITLGNFNFYATVFDNADNLRLFKSIDGVSWLESDVINDTWSKRINGIHYNKEHETIVMVGNNGLIITSQDKGLSWQEVECGIYGSHFKNVNSYKQKVNYPIDNNDLNVWVAVGEGGVCVSEDGIDWEHYGVSSRYFNDIIYYQNNLWYGVDEYSNIVKFNINKIGGILNLTYEDVINLDSDDIYAIDYDRDNSIAVLVTWVGNIYTTTDFVNFIERDSDIGSTLRDVKYSKKQNKWVAVGFNGYSTISDNGIVWSFHNTTLEQDLFSIEYNDILDLWVTAGDNGVLAYSEDGYNWNKVEDTFGTNRIFSLTTDYELELIFPEIPNITINSPINNYEYNYTNILIDINATDSNGIDKIWFEYNDTIYNYTIPLYFDFQEGLNNLIVYANNTLGLQNMVGIEFNIDTTPLPPPPSVPKFEMFEINNTGRIYYNDSISLKFQISDLDQKNLSVMTRWYYLNNDSEEWFLHLDNNEIWNNQEFLTYHNFVYYTTIGTVNSSYVNEGQWWMANGFLTDGDNDIFINSTPRFISSYDTIDNNIPIVTNKGSSTSSSNPAQKNTMISFFVSGVDYDNDTIKMKVCRNEDATWVSCSLLCQNLDGVEWHETNPTSITCNYVVNEDEFENNAYFILYDGNDFISDNNEIKYYVGVTPSPTGGGGGGSTIEIITPDTPKEVCDITVMPFNVEINDNKLVVELNVINNEDISYTPEYRFKNIENENSILQNVQLTNELGTVLSGSQKKFGVKYKGGIFGTVAINGKAELVLISSRCEDVIIPISMNITSTNKLAEFFQSEEGFFKGIFGLLNQPILDKITWAKNWLIVLFVGIIFAILFYQNKWSEKDSVNIGLKILAWFFVVSLLSTIIISIIRAIGSV